MERAFCPLTAQAAFLVRGPTADSIHTECPHPARDRLVRSAMPRHKRMCVRKNLQSCGSGTRSRARRAPLEFAYMTSPKHKPRPSLLAACAVPWRYVLRPRRAARLMIAAPPLAFWLMFSAHAAAIAVGLVLIALWRDSVPWLYFTWSQGQPPPQDFILDVWFRWHADGWFGAAEIAFLVIIGVTLLGSLFLAWLSVVRVQRDGPFWPAFFAAHRVVGSSAGMFAIAVLLPFWLESRAELRERLGRPGGGEIEHILCALSYPAGTALLLVWLGAALSGRPLLRRTGRRTQRCEDCGYDLATQPDDGVCSECGLAIATSRRAGMRRRALAWAAEIGPSAWMNSTTAALFRPRSFYQSLPLRSAGGRGFAFAATTYVLIGLGASNWIVACFALFAPSPDSEDFLAIGLGAALVAPQVAWLIHRSVTAIAASAWAYSRALPDFALAARAAPYESAFLWVICVYSGGLITTFFAFEDWISRSVGVHGFIRTFGAPPEVLAGFGGNFLLCLAWLIRYRWIGRAICWANH